MAKIDKELLNLKLKISEMAEKAIEMVKNAAMGLFERDDEKLKWVVKKDNEVDLIDNEIDGMAVKICAIRQPEAGDLRFILSSMKINVAIERVADNAVNIAQWAQKINEHPQLKPYMDLPKMEDIAINMVKDSINAFFLRDVKKSKEVIERDDIVDNYEIQIMRELLTFVMEEPKNIRTVIRLIFVARALERIADQATNIAEQAIFVTTGEIYKHRRKKE